MAEDINHHVAKTLLGEFPKDYFITDQQRENAMAFAITATRADQQDVTPERLMGAAQTILKFLVLGI